MPVYVPGCLTRAARRIIRYFLITTDEQVACIHEQRLRVHNKFFRDALMMIARQQVWVVGVDYKLLLFTLCQNRNDKSRRYNLPCLVLLSHLLRALDYSLSTSTDVNYTGSVTQTKQTGYSRFHS